VIITPIKFKFNSHDPLEIEKSPRTQKSEAVEVKGEGLKVCEGLKVAVSGGGDGPDGWRGFSFSFSSSVKEPRKKVSDVSRLILRAFT
jgi:hypothetical protein